MDPGLSPQKALAGTAYITNLWMMKHDKMTPALGLSNTVSQRAVCRDNKKADVKTPELKMNNIVES